MSASAPLRLRSEKSGDERVCTCTCTVKELDRDICWAWLNHPVWESFDGDEGKLDIGLKASPAWGEWGGGRGIGHRFKGIGFRRRDGGGIGDNVKDKM